MKKLLAVVLHHTRPLSKTLLLASFGAGYLLASLLFAFLDNQMHRFLQYLFF